MLTRRRFKTFSLSAPIILGLIFWTCCAPKCSGYSVLTHEAIIDAAWKESIVPVLLKRFPSATPEELLQAHAYAYGGAIIQDLGYYPFGNSFFSDLTHYVRTGEFVLALIEESTNYLLRAPRSPVGMYEAPETVGRRKFQQIYAASSRIRLMQVNRRSDAPDAQIDHFYKCAEGQREIDIALRYVQAETLANQGDTNQEQERHRKNFHRGVAIHEGANGTGGKHHHGGGQDHGCDHDRNFVDHTDCRDD
jgi:zinc dependent phospholipase C